MSKRLEDIRNNMNNRFAQMSKTMDDMRSDMNFRFNILLALNICIVGAILAVLFKLFFLKGFMFPQLVMVDTANFRFS